MAKTSIEWSDYVWNPTTGCTKVSQGCKNCYAEKMSKRLFHMGKKKYRNIFKYTQHENEIDAPLKWKKPRKIFVNSMSDLFINESDLTFVGKCFDTMVKANWHTYQVLTKRPVKMVEFSNIFYRFYRKPIPEHIWMGVSVEDEDNVWRIDELRNVLCGIRFISFEPLLGLIRNVNLEKIDLAIIGGESGYGFRPVQKEWILDLIKQCKEQNVKVFFKQWGGIRPKSGGREIDGKTYEEYPEFRQGVVA